MVKGFLKGPSGPSVYSRTATCSGASLSDFPFRSKAWGPHLWELVMVSSGSYLWATETVFAK